MANKTYQGRIVQKHDTSANWAKATNFIPLKGEIIIYDDLNKIKIGDGTTNVNDLNFSEKYPLFLSVIEKMSSDDYGGDYYYQVIGEIPSGEQNLVEAINKYDNYIIQLSDNANTDLDIDNYAYLTTLYSDSNIFYYVGYYLNKIIMLSNPVSTNDATTAIVKITVNTLAYTNDPNFTGTPTAPTASAGTNTTQIATTAFVKNAIDNIAEYTDTEIETIYNEVE